ncbi:Hypothetical protein R9X50_00120000 [Acrodontium crateriforme]|uniref:Uncharacterized protein n=1 Tax=Acrodontium crateriforme TaxID=150365 RepID=A0AAQ3R7P4_9PEZI|nr:Hypothetical protein R9X50_00120000 [Acrodontium crateriforme]
MAISANGIGTWAYAVPLDEKSGGVLPSEDTTRAQSARLENQRVSAYQDLRPAAKRRPSGYTSDSEAGSRRSSMRSASVTATRKRSTNTLREKRSDNTMTTARQRDESAWIHRDKLAQIEIQEMEEAGIPVIRHRRSLSVGGGRDRQSDSIDRSREVQSAMDFEHHDSVAGDEQYIGGRSGKRISPPPVTDFDQDHGYYDTGMEPSVQTREDQSSEQSFHGHNRQRSNSKIPVSKTSPRAAPQSTRDRESPAFEQARSNSAGSQVLLDDTDERSSPEKARSPTSNSPTKSRTSKNANPAGRKTSSTSATGRPTSSHKNRAPSSTNRKAHTTSGHKSRPSTSSKPPEGDAPWIATMFKPDPRLPPEQQMLPTHAKRLMQEQWEKEGKPGTAYDTELRLLDDEEIRSPSKEKAGLHLADQETPAQKDQPVDSPNSPTWPLTPPSETNSARPSTSGGYKITPTINPPPAVQRQVTSPSPSGHTQLPQPPQHMQHPPSRMSDLTEKDEPPPKKFLCCIIM